MLRLTFSGMKSFPHDHTLDIEGDKDFPFFYGYGDSVVKYISAFITFCKKNDFFDEDVMMKFFTCNLSDSAKMWYESLDKGMFSSFAEFLESFYVRWDYDLVGWLPLVHEIK
jgi:hypothetical protein